MVVLYQNSDMLELSKSLFQRVIKIMDRSINRVDT